MPTHACPVIGYIRTPHTAKETAPRQTGVARNAPGRVELLPEYVPGLRDIEGFSHLILLYAMDRAGEPELIATSRLDRREHGVFATRSPRRPSAIGLSVVRLAAVESGVLVVEGIDALDNTPLLDIKPYLPQYDAVPEAARGWTGEVAEEAARP